jgi:succinyl-diaminopimelate desuccinylase
MPDSLAKYLIAQQEPMKAALKELVRIPSVLSEGDGGYPFGGGVDQALRKALEIAAGLGFHTRYGDGGYYGIAETGDGEEMIGILGHLDVVPAGNPAEWDHDPFDPVEQDGMLFGRGTQDDKGPMMAALFAVKALMLAGVQFNKRVRFIFGGDEENLWRCIKRYKEKEEIPGMGFSPDSRFPLTYAEKGLLQLHLVGNNSSGVRLSGGSAMNAVPSQAFYYGPRQNELISHLESLGFAYARNGNSVEVLGKATHAMDAEEGINAIARLCIALRDIGVESKAINFIAQEIGEDPYARRIFGECADEPSGKLKFNIGKIEIDGMEQISIDTRIPVTVPKEEIVKKITDTASQYGLAYQEHDWLAPTYVPLDHFIVKNLLKVYQQHSGDHSTPPRASGGATYARSMPNCVAYGALLPDEEVTEHQPNERAVLKNLHKAMQIYAQAVKELLR